MLTDPRFKSPYDPIRFDYHEEMKYIDEETQDMVATLLEVKLAPMEGMSGKEKSLIVHHACGNGIQLLSPSSVDPTRPLLNGYKAKNRSDELALLRQWMDTCVEKHTLKIGTGSCRRPPFRGVDPGRDISIRVIDVQHRRVVEQKPEDIEYAALSYVWDEAHRGMFKILDEHAAGNEVQGPSSTLHSRTPKVLEDAILVCKELGIEYLWVDRYCIDQSDLIRKESEIQTMAFRYLYAKITLIAGISSSPDNVAEIGLLPDQNDSGIQQRVEKIQGREYITALPTMIDQIHASQWHRRAWTMQEGQLSNRCAFFGQNGVSFLCGQGHWTKSLHNGTYGHDATMPSLKTNCEGYYMLSWRNWIKDKTWKFEDYNELLMSFTPRDLSFQSDKLNAIAGCLNFITEVKGVSFVRGLPTADFQYALLWSGEYDRPREGFPSWSWAGWHSLQNSHIVYPANQLTSTLRNDGGDVLRTGKPDHRDIELQGLLVTLTERPHHTNKCSQRFADIMLFPENLDFLYVIGEVAHFSVEMKPDSSPLKEKFFASDLLDVPRGFDSTDPARSAASWELDSEYCTPYTRLSLRDAAGNVSQYHYPRWYDHWPVLMLNFPKTLRGSTLTRLLREGIDMVMIAEIKMLEGEDLRPFHLVLCLGVDKSVEPARRCGMYCLPKEVWTQACPVSKTVVMG